MNFKLLFLMFLLTVINVCATIDLSNLDFTNFNFFKYPSTTEKPLVLHRNGHLVLIQSIPKKPSKFEDLLNRSKAVVTYFTEVAFGKKKERINVKHIVDPDMGEKLSYQFQQKYGKNGEKLIEFLGSGPSRESLIRANVI